MTTLECKKTDCTIAATGKCLETHGNPVADCPFLLSRRDGVDTTNATMVALETSVARKAADSTSESGRTFPAGLELGWADAVQLSRSRYVHLVGVLGQTNAGKTCLLTSLYLLAINRQLLPHFTFAGSKTLVGFEHRARGLRKWTSGSLATQFVDHTRLVDPRSPSFVHISFEDASTPAHRYDLLLTDLPGEWTSELVERADTATRFAFLSRADAIVIAVDGSRLALPAAKRQELMQNELLIQRLAETIKLPNSTRLILVITKCDEFQNAVEDAVNALRSYAETYGFQPDIVQTAAISRNPSQTPNGHGMLRLLELITRPFVLAESDPGTGPKGRSFLQYIRSGERHE